MANLFSGDDLEPIANVNYSGGYVPQMLVYEFMAGGTLRDHLIRTFLLPCVVLRCCYLAASLWGARAVRSLRQPETVVVVASIHIIHSVYTNNIIVPMTDN